MTIFKPWYLEYHTPSAPPRSGIISEFVEIDWAFIVGSVLSLMALLLTFDGICGDRRDGTLQLVLGGAVSRAAVLGGKFLGALTVLVLALIVGMLVNLSIISLSGSAVLDAEMLLKVAAMGVAAILYLAFFTALGLLISSRFERPSSSLVTLLLVWTVLLFLLPNTTAGMVGSFRTGKEVKQQDRDAAVEASWEKHGIRRLFPPDPGGRMPYEYVGKIAAFIADWLSIERRFEEASLRQQLDQVELGKNLSRITPFGVFQYALESLADTGLPRHKRFIRDAGEYQTVFREFVQVRDASDPDSYHLMGIAEGMSRKPVPEEAVPVFKEDLSARATIAATLPDLALLALFAVAAFMAAHLAFLRGDVA